MSRYALLVMNIPHDAPESLGPESLVAAFLAAFAAGDADRLDEVYEADAVLVPRPGAPVTGPDRPAANRHLLGFGLPMQAAVRHVYQVGDLALLVVDWSLRGRTRDGVPVDLAGTATDVARRGPDGTWRYVIDNPMGTAPVPPG